MNPSRADELALRRTQLQQRSRRLRDRTLAHAEALSPALTWAERGLEAWQWLRARPPALVVPLAVVTGVWVARRPSRLFTTPWRLWTVWRLWLRVSAAQRP
ncbi:MAG: hypothetical protein KF871_05285 [Hydrogenophaga sp.]|uniref:hypothetical protein n=1 Tax=Hydrogenophaga sp. TaxID=1904254 RepID=UPI001D5B60EF|nr:hypothetical protein [Hydrogenophaga sp.]MBX3609290.1 hypothetical protein [Hydrogenophaga sp.]